MKGLSLWEPWATAVALDLKGFETRSWATSYRGPLLICASKIRPPLIKIIHLLVKVRLTLNDLNYGRAVCIVDLVDVLKTEDIVVSNLERAFGDYTPGRYAWKFENIRRFANPPLVRGGRRLFEVSDYYEGLETYDSIDPNPQREGPVGSGSIPRESVEAGVQEPAEGGQDGYPKDPTV
jgi:hypothetical protein